MIEYDPEERQDRVFPSESRVGAIVEECSAMQAIAFCLTSCKPILSDGDIRERTVVKAFEPGIWCCH